MISTTITCDRCGCELEPGPDGKPVAEFLAGTGTPIDCCSRCMWEYLDMCRRWAEACMAIGERLDGDDECAGPDSDPDPATGPDPAAPADPTQIINNE
jgi:hypothetical protein